MLTVLVVLGSCDNHGGGGVNGSDVNGGSRSVGCTTVVMNWLLRHWW